MPQKLKYSIHCVTEGANVEAWAEAPLTECPNNAGHEVIADSVAIIGKADRIGIMKDIMAACADQAQLDRILAAMDKYPTILCSLDCSECDISESRLSLALADETITQADYDLIISKIP